MTINLNTRLDVNASCSSQQAQLEAEIENLSWKIERVETTDCDRGDIENQMDIAEKRRMILLKDFFPTHNISEAK